MNILHIVRLMFRTVFDAFYVWNHVYILEGISLDFVLFYFFMFMLIILFIRRLVL